MFEKFKKLPCYADTVFKFVVFNEFCKFLQFNVTPRPDKVLEKKKFS